MSEIHEGRVVRVNRFQVPAEARDEFLELIEATHEVIRMQPGFIDDMILEQQSGSGLFSLLTVLQFEGEHVLQSVITAVARFDQASGIDRQALTRRLGVEASVGFYRHAKSDGLVLA
ncbi:antibiotic biosynthesis monooxygenase [Rhizobium sp. XQZ8]|uniref:antibiotic biosynthesis monooxygenase family protein n=1 Tax=Rhizobium populisoli TaxID=2859785 RepID=UPI001CA5EF84|nr:antibiotic biosynthesis monooxygenase [Rhizobium populisoli]MBW6422947.1 antibiotic biosynthesis monooxygenase [Rhizobium populisoli]